MTPYQQSFVDLLSKYEFTIFGTFTTRRTLSMAGARRLAVKFANQFEAGEKTSMFWAAEPFDTRWGYHFHGLLNPYSRYSTTDYWQWWSVKMDLGRSQFVEVNRQNGNAVEMYCLKYCLKKLSDYDLYIADYSGKTGTPKEPDQIKPYSYEQHGK